MTDTAEPVALSSSLEDYLETVFELVRDRKVARVKDIARARGVRAASVTPAMHRLAELGLIEYVEREYIDLTPAGEQAARRVYARHRVLERFFQQVLGAPAQVAQTDACAMEHSLSDEGMDHLVRFLEFIQVCPDARAFVSQFHQCARLTGDTEECRGACRTRPRRMPPRSRNLPSVADLEPGQRARVTLVDGSGAVRQRLLDMGLLPNVELEVQRVAPGGGPVWIKFEGTQLSLRRNEAQAVLVEP
jgi:DtxR family Mn-dependent transcriptional regulator